MTDGFWQRHHGVIAIIVSGGIAVGGAACSGSGSLNVPASTTPNAETIDIGLVVSETGADQAAGLQVRDGAELAVDRINAFGGILGKQLRLIEKDDTSDPTKTVSLIQGLVAQNVVLGIGPSSDTAALAMNSMATASPTQIMYISPSASSPSLDIKAAGNVTSIAPVLLRTTPTSDHLATAMRNFATEQPMGSTQRCRSAVLVYENDAYGTVINQDLAMLLGASESVALPMAVSLTADPTDTMGIAGAATSAAGELSAATQQPVCQIVIAQAETAGEYMLAYQAATTKLSPPAGATSWQSVTTIGSDGFRDPAFIQFGRKDQSQTMSATAGEGSYAIAADTSPTGTDTTGTPDFTSFQELFAAAYPGADVGRYTSTAYDAVMMLAIGIARAGDPTALDLIRTDAFQNSQGAQAVSAVDMVDFFTKLGTTSPLNYVGASGPVDFLQTGGVLTGFGVWQVEQAAYTWDETYPASVVSE